HQVRSRFVREGKALSRLNHPNVVTIYSCGETDDGLLYIAMEFLDGKSLHEILQEDRVLSARRSLKIAQQIAKSLREAHSKGIVHRDLKPDNIFLCTVGEEHDFVKVLDFGVAKLRDGDTPGKDLTKTGTIFGTPKYMSPEQARAGMVDARSDLYAIGIILYEMLTGRAPFMAENSLSILIQHIQEAVPRFEAVQPDLVFPEPVTSLTYRLLAKRAEERPQTAEALIREAATVLEGLDDIYRNVLTRAEAVEIGLDMALTPRTRHDTVLNNESTQGAPTEGPFQEPTVAIDAKPAPKRRLGGLALVAALGLVSAAAAGVYASLPPLPSGFLELENLSEARVGVLPQLALPMSTVGVTTQPVGVEIEGLDQPVRDTSGFNITRPVGAEPLELTFKKEGFTSRTYTFNFDEAAPPPVLITLEVAPKTLAPAVKTSRPRQRPRKPTTNPSTAPAKPVTASEPVAKPAVVAPPVAKPVVVAPPPVAKPVVAAPPVAKPVVVTKPVAKTPAVKKLPATPPSKLSKLKSVKPKARKLKSPRKLR
ncbi:MAG: serine/threonine-protein kinase, partial [Myxococcota bacterium]|nr:serine/threonine-protein kinase [Myxococcota bacterium]